MKKISTLFKKNPENLGLVINEINPENQWVFDGDGIPTRKYDGTAVAIIDGEIYKRYDVKKGRQVPDGAIPCQEADLITGHHPHWLKCSKDKNEDKYFFEGFYNMTKNVIIHANFNPNVFDGTYELIGEKVQGNPEKIKGHMLVSHGAEVLQGLVIPMTFENLKSYLENVDIEGIVFHHKTDYRMCKLRKSDFGIKRLV
jgi:hypothetical protein